MNLPKRLTSLARGLFLALVFLFLFAPSVVVVVFSFNESRFFSLPIKGYTFDWYREMIHRTPLIDATKNSFYIATLTVVVSVGLGSITGVIFNRWRANRIVKSMISSVIPMPLLLPGLIWGLALLILFSRFDVRLSIWTVLAAHVLLTLPLVILIISTRLQTLDPAVEEAALSLGATYPETLYRVVLPHIAPALLASGLMTFTISFNEFILSFFLTGGGFNTLPIYIYSLIRWEASPIINAIATVMLVFAGLLVLAMYWIEGARALRGISRQSGEGDPAEPGAPSAIQVTQGATS
ncbi:MAG: ABC transporter permease [Thermomicrobiales bacterium]|nr:ABC transporter permease [Thermomicrobiales bacterium]MCO5221571.1 ABC transporter permease [Thermomicrobiales bacterium]